MRLNQEHRRLTPGHRHLIATSSESEIQFSKNQRGQVKGRLQLRVSENEIKQWALESIDTLSKERKY